MHVSLTKLLARHWQVTVPVLLVTLLACFLVERATPPAYSAVGSMMLATPAHDPSRVSESVNQLRAAVAELQRAQVREELIVGGASLDTQFTDQTLLAVTATADTAAGAERTAAGAVEWLGDALSERQEAAGIAANQRLVGRLLTPTVVARQQLDETYIAQAIVWVDGLGGPEENPYGANMVTARLLVLAASGAEGRGAIEDRIGEDVSFLVWTDPRDEIPLLTVLTEGQDARDVLDAFGQITAVMDLHLDGRQARAQVPHARRVFIDVLSRPEVATDDRPLVGAATIVVALLGLAAAGGAGTLASRRRRSAPRPSPSNPRQRRLLWLPVGRPGT